MPRVAAPNFGGFSQVAHQLAQEKLEARRLSQAAQAQRANTEFRQQQLWQQGAIAAARMQQGQQQFEAGMAMDERRAGLSEIQEARRQFEAVQEGEFRKQQEAQRAQMDEVRFKANDVQRSVATGTVYDFATGQRRAMTKDDPLWDARQDFLREQHEEKQRAYVEEQRAAARFGFQEAAAGRAQTRFEERGAGLSPQQEIDFDIAREQAMKAGELGRYYQPPRMATAPAKEIRAKRTAISGLIDKVAKLEAKRTESLEEGVARTGRAPDTKVLDERLEIAQTNLREMRAELVEMEGGEIEQPAPLGRQELPTEASMDSEAERLGIQRPGVTGATAPPTLDKMTYEWWYEQVLPSDLAGKYAGTGAIPALRGLWDRLRSGEPGGEEEWNSLPLELKRTVTAELRRLNLLPKVPR